MEACNPFNDLPRDILKLIFNELLLVDDILAFRHALGKRGLTMDEFIFSRMNEMKDCCVFPDSFVDSRLGGQKRFLMKLVSPSKRNYVINSMFWKKFSISQTPNMHVLKAGSSALNFVSERVHFVNEETLLLCGKKILCLKTKESRRFVLTRSNSSVQYSFEPEFDRHIFVSR